MSMAKTTSGKRSGRRSESGTAAIEFALFLPFLFILLVGTVDLGFAMYEAMQVSNAVEAGMLYAAKNGWDSAGITNSVLSASSVYPGGTPALTATPAPRRFCGCPQATGITEMACLFPIPPNPPPTCADGITTAGVYVQVNAALNHLIILSLPGLPVPSTFTAKAVVRVN
ncbi:TadE/TadG family type IV pilus assembly protein [Bradyrhizobium sp. SZCCHNR1070]|uniref:TadE/TadG family type IV pilus assembly protein n=1 Tax=Bradyrhizobium sp. SZCCHNR1070 TaxID=3057361 RepID=UPI00291602F1|nr:TadE/TadG family type IV pilus assembly protein [Bradyrhizobium sp. SZCCHNR1070]